MKGKSLSRVRLFATPWTSAYQAPLSMGFSRQESWSGVPLPSPLQIAYPQTNSSYLASLFSFICSHCNHLPDSPELAILYLFYFSSLHVLDSESIISLSFLLITTSAATAFVWQSVASAEIQLSFLCAYPQLRHLRINLPNGANV